MLTIIDPRTEGYHLDLWNPKNFNPQDIQFPTLERTTLYGRDLSQDQINQIRQFSENSPPITSRLKPMEADASIPTFRDKFPEDETENTIIESNEENDTGNE